MRDLSELRAAIDVVDDELVRLFVQRMDLVEQVAEAKRRSGAAVLDADREREVLTRAATAAGPARAAAAQEFLKKAMELARQRESEIV